MWYAVYRVLCRYWMLLLISCMLHLTYHALFLSLSIILWRKHEYNIFLFILFRDWIIYICIYTHSWVTRLYPCLLESILLFCCFLSICLLYVRMHMLYLSLYHKSQQKLSARFLSANPWGSSISLCKPLREFGACNV